MVKESKQPISKIGFFGFLAHRVEELGASRDKDKGVEWPRLREPRSSPVSPVVPFFSSSLELKMVFPRLATPNILFPGLKKKCH